MLGRLCKLDGLVTKVYKGLQIDYSFVYSNVTQTTDDIIN